MPKKHQALHVPHELSVGELARRAGVAVSALHFYEAKGLIHSTRNAGNQRRYPRDVLRRVAVIKVAQRVGIPLNEIAEALASLPSGRSPMAADWARLSARWLWWLLRCGCNIAANRRETRPNTTRAPKASRAADCRLDLVRIAGARRHAQ